MPNTKIPSYLDKRYTNLEKLGDSDQPLKKGDKVRYIGVTDTQVKWGSNDDPRLVLEEGKIYTISSVDIHSWHTKVELEGIEGRFNSVSFEPAEGI
jgi:hypothetical protein